MKYCLLSIFLFFGVFCIAQNGDNGLAAKPIMAENEEPLALGGADRAGNDVSLESAAQKEEEPFERGALSGRLLPSEENNPPKQEEEFDYPLKSYLNKAEPSLEDFLKRQGDFLPQEKKEEKSDSVSQEIRSPLEPPSILADSAPKTESKTRSADVSAPVKAAEKSVSKEKQTARQSQAEREKESALTQAEMNPVTPKEKAEEKPPRLPNDWWGFLKGVVFTLVLGVAVWFLSKYQ